MSDKTGERKLTFMGARVGRWSESQVREDRAAESQHVANITGDPLMSGLLQPQAEAFQDELMRRLSEGLGLPYDKYVAQHFAHFSRSPADDREIVFITPASAGKTMETVTLERLTNTKLDGLDSAAYFIADKVERLISKPARTYSWDWDEVEPDPRSKLIDSLFTEADTLAGLANLQSKTFARIAWVSAGEAPGLPQPPKPYKVSRDTARIAVERFLWIIFDSNRLWARVPANQLEALAIARFGHKMHSHGAKIERISI